MICENAYGQLLINNNILQLGFRFFNISTPASLQFHTEERERVVGLNAEAEYISKHSAISKSASAPSFTNFGNHVESNHSNIISGLEVYVCVGAGECVYTCMCVSVCVHMCVLCSSGTAVNIHTYINFMQQPARIYENVCGQLLIYQ